MKERGRPHGGNDAANLLFNSTFNVQAYMATDVGSKQAKRRAGIYHNAEWTGWLTVLSRQTNP